MKIFFGSVAPCAQGVPVPAAPPFSRVRGGRALPGGVSGAAIVTLRAWHDGNSGDFTAPRHTSYHIPCVSALPINSPYVTFGRPSLRYWLRLTWVRRVPRPSPGRAHIGGTSGSTDTLDLRPGGMWPVPTRRAQRSQYNTLTPVMTHTYTGTYVYSSAPVSAIFGHNDRLTERAPAAKRAAWLGVAFLPGALARRAPSPAFRSRLSPPTFRLPSRYPSRYLGGW